MVWDNKLYALWEAGSPYVLDPATLETIGQDTFGNQPSDLYNQL